MDFGGILNQAWRILWRHKSLWIFGILAGCGGVSSSSGNSAANTPNLQFEFGRDFGEMPRWLQRFFVNLSENPGLIAGIGLLFLLVVVIVTVISLMGKIGLIKGTHMVDQGAGSLSFGEVWNASTPYFWRVLGLGLLIALIVFLIVIFSVVAFVGISVVTLGVGLLCLLPLLCLLIPVGMLAVVIIEQAYIAVVVDDVGVMEGLRRGWDVVINNFWNYVLMALILVLGIGLVGGFIVGIPVFIASLPVLAAFAAAGGDRAMNTGLILSGVLLLCALPVSLFLNGLLSTYVHSAWTLTYLRATRGPGGGAVVFPSPAVPVPPTEPYPPAEIEPAVESPSATEPQPPAEPESPAETLPDEPLPPAS